MCLCIPWYNYLNIKNLSDIYSCKVGYCVSGYGDSIIGTIDQVAEACANDPTCKAFQYTADYGFGKRCNSTKYGGYYGDTKHCFIGELGIAKINI